MTERITTVSRIAPVAQMKKLLRVAAYARVSTGKDAMLHSLAAQVSYYSALIQKNPETYFVIEGHTDSTGTAAYNALLGLQRAAAVRAWLVGNGVPVEHVYIRSCGSSMPLASTKGTREEQALNRRVEIHMRAGGEELPAGACDHNYKVDLITKITEQMAKGVAIPQTPSYRLPVGASQKEREAAETRKKNEQNRNKKRRNGR